EPQWTHRSSPDGRRSRSSLTRSESDRPLVSAANVRPAPAGRRALLRKGRFGTPRAGQSIAIANSGLMKFGARQIIAILCVLCLAPLAACGDQDGSEGDSAFVCDWIDQDIIVSVVGNDGFFTRGDLASSLDDSVKIADCHVVTDFGDKIITVK